MSALDDQPSEISVKYSGWIKLLRFVDAEQGSLTVGESERNIPFAIKRFYYLTDFSKTLTDLERGQHAHRQTNQVIFCLAGSFRLKLDDGQTKQELILSGHSPVGVYLGARLWHAMTDFSLDCVILTVADTYYDEADYLRDYGQWLKFIKQND